MAASSIGEANLVEEGFRLGGFVPRQPLAASDARFSTLGVLLDT